ncbi:hypothetical protein IE077_002838 [Cardiosporidium cionae]|uniref:mRNA export factor GLE1 n=1 Tax=Cardiosporidium cionae TaxID=476202 RepID=A0ABQ7J9T6_9APIC|nr:hypothetical protein IE077_002838 [Cardiosporidium cionae]|eukprot:KAF8820760.1 hypothetical protein IE077_002838 [Cardiosporidium cionae]
MEENCDLFLSEWSSAMLEASPLEEPISEKEREHSSVCTPPKIALDTASPSETPPPGSFHSLSKKDTSTSNYSPPYTANVYNSRSQAGNTQNVRLAIQLLPNLADNPNVTKIPAPTGRVWVIAEKLLIQNTSAGNKIARLGCNMDSYGFVSSVVAGEISAISDSGLEPLFSVDHHCAFLGLSIEQSLLLKYHEHILNKKKSNQDHKEKLGCKAVERAVQTQRVTTEGRYDAYLDKLYSLQEAHQKEKREKEEKERKQKLLQEAAQREAEEKKRKEEQSKYEAKEAERLRKVELQRIQMQEEKMRKDAQEAKLIVQQKEEIEQQKKAFEEMQARQAAVTSTSLVTKTEILPSSSPQNEFPDTTPSKESSAVKEAFQWMKKQQFYEKGEYEKIQTEAEIKSIRISIKRKINTVLNQIANTNHQVFKSCKELIQFFHEIAQTHVYIQRYALFLCVELFLRQCSIGAQMDINASSVWGYAAVIRQLMRAFPEILEIFYGKLFSCCSYAVPFYYRKMKGMTHVYFEQLRGQLPSEGEETFFVRMATHLRFYTAFLILQEDFETLWIWFSRFLNLNSKKPRRICTLLLLTALEVSAHSLLAVYKNQFRKVLQYIETCFVQKLRKLKEELTAQYVFGL